MVFLYKYENPRPYASFRRVKVVGLSVSMCVLVSMWSHFELCFLQQRMSFGSQTSVIAANRVYYHFVSLLMISGPWIFQEEAKSDLRFSMVSKAF